jgi:hypothetical protein
MKITIVLCWLSLFSFWAIKLFGGNWFEIMVENENFIKFSNTVQNTWLKYLVSLITIFVSYYFMYGAVLQKVALKGKYLAVYLLSALANWAVVNFVPIDFVRMIFGYTLIIITSICYQKGIKKYFGVLTVILDFVFSTLSMLTRGIKLSFITDYFILLIGSLDLYIMLGLYFLYSNLLNLKKEE